MRVFLMIFCRTDLRISQYKSKNCKESAGTMRFDVDPQKPCKNMKKRAFQTKFLDRKIFPASKNEMSEIIQNAFSQSLAAVRAMFEG